MKIYQPERLNRLPDAFLFDLDNTLYSYDAAHTAAQEAVRHKVGRTFSMTPEAYDQAFDQAREQVKNRLKNTASSHSRLLYFQRMLEIMGLGSQVLLALDFEQTYWRTFLSHAVLFDDVKEFMDDIRLLGIPIAVVTDLTAQIQFRKIVYLGLDHCFDFIVTSEEAGCDKPHGVPFQMALEKLKPKGHCIWMIGDNPINDIKSAREQIQAVTLQKIHAGVKRGVGNEAPDASFETFADFRKYIAKLGEG